MRLPHVFIEMGMNVRHFGSMLANQTGSVTHADQSFSYRVVMPGGTSTPADVAMTSTMRIGFGLTHGLYTGIEGELGGLVSPGQASTQMMDTGSYGSPQISQGAGLVAGGYAIAGLAGATRHATFALEVAGGARTVRYAFDSTFNACNQTSHIGVTRGLLEARARAELWLNPWISAGATLGSSVIEHGDWLAGLYFGFHTRAFGGGR